MMKQLFLLLCLAPCMVSAQWTAVSTPSSINGPMAVVNDSTVFYANGAKTIYVSHNAGATWNYFETEYEYEFIEDMDFINDSVGFACGGGWFSPHRNVVLRTTNAGQSWETLTRDSVGNLQFLFSEVDFVSIDSGMVVQSYGYDLYRTVDGGISWQQIVYDSTQLNQTISDLHFVNSSLGFLTTRVSSGTMSKARIYRTTDFGNTWQSVREWDYPGGYYTIHFVNDRVGYVGGNQGVLCKTTDGGVTWSESKIPPGNAISALWFTDEQTGYSNAFGVICKTTDGGANWFPQMMMGPNIVSAIQMTPSGTSGFLIANNILYKTTNGGGITYVWQPELQEKISIYPNPSRGITYLQYNVGIKVQQLQLVDATGKVIKHFPHDATKLSFPEVAPGIYFLRIKTEQGTLSKKITVQ